MRIGVDCDEPLYDLVGPLLEFYNQRHNTRFARKDVTEYSLAVLWRCTRDQAIDETHRFYDNEQFLNLPVTQGAQAATKILSRKNELYVVSGRPTIIQNKTNYQIAKDYPGTFKRIVCTGQWSKEKEASEEEKIDKMIVCKELQINTMIDDSLEDAIRLALNDVTVHLLDASWNQLKNNQGLLARYKLRELPGNIHRHLTWLGIVSSILNL